MILSKPMVTYAHNQWKLCEIIQQNAFKIIVCKFVSLIQEGSVNPLMISYVNIGSGYGLSQCQATSRINADLLSSVN